MIVDEIKDLRAVRNGEVILPPAPEVITPLTQRLAARRFNIHTKPPEPVPVFLINRIPASTAGNITAVSAMPKAGKSAFCGAVMAAAMTNSPTEADCLGVTSRNPEGKALIHIDTEQSESHHFNLVELATRRALLTEPPPWLCSHWLSGFSTLDIRSAVALLMKEYAEKFGGIHSVILDGVADAAVDVNDAEESNKLVGDFHALAIQYACPIVGVIHLNPGSESKTRGHLGSQLERKAETNLRLERDDEAVVVYSDRSRGAPIPKAHAPRFAWSSERMMFVSVESVQDSKDAAEREALQTLAVDVFAGRPAMRYSEIVSTVMTVNKVKDRTAERKVEAMNRLTVIRKGVAGLYTICTPA